MYAEGLSQSIFLLKLSHYDSFLFSNLEDSNLYAQGTLEAFFELPFLMSLTMVLTRKAMHVLRPEKLWEMLTTGIAVQYPHFC